MGAHRANLTEGSHTYGALWTPYSLQFYFDGNMVAEYVTPEDMERRDVHDRELRRWRLLGQRQSGSSGAMSINSIRAYQLKEYTLANYTLKTSAAATASVNGTAAAEILAGSIGADRLDGKGGADTLQGGLGDDTYVVDATGVTVAEGFGAGIDTVLSSVGFALKSNVENLLLTGAASIDATGNTMSNILTGNSGANLIDGAEGNDILTGAAGADTFVLRRGDGSDIITDFQPGTGSDVVRLLNHGFTAFEEVKAAMTQQGNDVHLKLGAFETLVFRNTTLSSFDSSDFELPVKPTMSAEFLQVVHRQIDGQTSPRHQRAGNLPGPGRQGRARRRISATTPYWINANTTVIEKAGEGIDTAVTFTYGSFTLAANVENLLLQHAGTGNGNTLGNYLRGSTGADILNGKAGNDWLVGGAGNDTFVLEKGYGFDTIEDFKGRLRLQRNRSAGVLRLWQRRLPEQ